MFEGRIFRRISIAYFLHTSLNICNTCICNIYIYDMIFIYVCIYIYIYMYIHLIITYIYIYAHLFIYIYICVCFRYTLYTFYTRSRCCDCGMSATLRRPGATW